MDTIGKGRETEDKDLPGSEDLALKLKHAQTSLLATSKASRHLALARCLSLAYSARPCPAPESRIIGTDTLRYSLSLSFSSVRNLLCQKQDHLHCVLYKYSIEEYHAARISTSSQHVTTYQPNCVQEATKKTRRRRSAFCSTSVKSWFIC